MLFIFRIHSSSLRLKRTISRNSAIAIVIGGIIGSGIFMKPSVMALQLGAPMLLLSVWVVAGLVTLFGALSNAEVATMFPETGGQYVFFQKMYGKFFSFLYGWAAFAVFNTAGNASIAYVCSEYANRFLHLPRLDGITEQSFYLFLPGVGKLYMLQNLGVKVLTMFLVVLFTWINYKSVQYGTMTQRILTALKVGAIGLLIIGLLASPKGSVDHFYSVSAITSQGFPLMSAYMAAVAGAFWAYDGWNNIPFIAGEIQQPGKNIFRSLIIGVTSCIFIYLLVNVALIYMMPIGQMAASLSVANDAATIAWGMTGGLVITLMVVGFTLGTTNSNVLATARVTCAWSKENRVFSPAGRIHKIHHTPGNALLLNAAWSCGLILTGSFDMLTDMLVFVSWFFYMMSGVGLFILRYKLPQHERPYKVWGYPFVPIVFILFAALFLGVTLYSDVTNYIAGKTTFINSVFGLVITFCGIPLYFFSKKKVTESGFEAE
jgi:APA family basic amino acid/polyamine antiporter